MPFGAALLRVRHAAILVARVAPVGFVSLGCNTGSPAAPTFDAGGADGGVDVGAGRDAGPDAVPDAALDATVSESGSDASGPVTYDICPDAMVATFPSIFTQLLSTASCGTGQPYACHSTTGALPAAEGGTGSLLDFSLDAAAVYAELLGADGGGYPAANVEGDAGGVILRVDPGDADASLLYIKLALTAFFDPRFGEAMPPVHTICPAAVGAVGTWIDDGGAPK
jgi:hypothetical protein